MKRRGCLGCTLVFLILLGVIFIAPFTFKLLRVKWEVHRLLANAKSVQIQHYRSWIDTGGKEQIIASRILAPTEYHKVAEAFPMGPDMGFPGGLWKCAPNPHHRIIITDASGNVTTISVCFECDHVELTQGGEKEGDLFYNPFIWRGSLRQFFADEGMAYSPGIYRNFDPATVSTNTPPTAAPK